MGTPGPHAGTGSPAVTAWWLTIARDAEGKVPSSIARNVAITITLEDKSKDLCVMCHTGLEH